MVKKDDEHESITSTMSNLDDTQSQNAPIQGSKEDKDDSFLHSRPSIEKNDS